MIKGANKYYYLKDGLGSVGTLTDTNGNIVESYTYDEYGNVSAPSQIGNRYLYTGREYDPEINLYYYRTRYYDPTIGRFLQTDPIGYIGGINLYTYVKNNPINWKDPSGWESVIVNTIPGPSGEPVPIYRDTETGRASIGNPNDFDPFTAVIGEALEPVRDAIDAAVNNPISDAVGTIPPTTPGVPPWVTYFEVFREIWNRINNLPPKCKL